MEKIKEIFIEARYKVYADYPFYACKGNFEALSEDNKLIIKYKGYTVFDQPLYSVTPEDMRNILDKANLYIKDFDCIIEAYQRLVSDVKPILPEKLRLFFGIHYLALIKISGINITIDNDWKIEATKKGQIDLLITENNIIPNIEALEQEIEATRKIMSRLKEKFQKILNEVKNSI